MAQLRAVKASGVSIKNAVLKQQYESLKPIKLSDQTLYKAKEKLKNIKTACNNATLLPILQYKNNPTSMAIRSLLKRCDI